ncbi:MAG TPA: lipoyl(octanoyl) transferase, partial [Burkholderiales bacterium]|nr:lipoyl(octanoyl) transferase [Burkholderiales bacterium]
MTLVEDVVVKRLGRVEYLSTWQAMRAFTTARNESTPDELWLLEHPSVYTVGQGAPESKLPNVIRSDRGGDITYHGPGQAVIYTLVDLARRSIKVKGFVWLLEQAVIDLL